MLSIFSKFILTKLIAILNITPDSFFDGGKYNAPDLALQQAQKLIDDGADIIDIGAESTRPGAIPITTEEEWKRLEQILPLIIKLAKNHNVKISLDSRNYQTIYKALECGGIDIINDVSGFSHPKMIELAAQSGKKIIVMHNLGIPADKNKIIPTDLDVIEVIIEWMAERLNLLLQSGVKQQQIIFDPGIGFGKNAAQSMAIIKNIERLKIFNLPLLIGHSRKSFLDYNENKTAEISSYLAKKHIEYLRVHNICQK